MQIIEKPWGQEEIIEINDRYMVKRLTMWKGHSCSLQYHNQKKETIFVLCSTRQALRSPTYILFYCCNFGVWTNFK